MAIVDLHFVNELIQARETLHGGSRGAPLVKNQHRVGTSINRSCIVMLSALLQSYIEDLFKEAVKRAFPKIGSDDKQMERYWKQMKGWGNPSDDNIETLFLKIGVPEVLNGLSWQATNSESIKEKLKTMNLIRNQIAHGHKKLNINDRHGNTALYSLTLEKVKMYRNFVESFAFHFSRHMEALIPQAAAFNGSTNISFSCARALASS